MYALGALEFTVGGVLLLWDSVFSQLRTLFTDAEILQVMLRARALRTARGVACDP